MGEIEFIYITKWVFTTSKKDFTTTSLNSKRDSTTIKDSTTIRARDFTMINNKKDSTTKDSTTISPRDSTTTNRMENTQSSTKKTKITGTRAMDVTEWLKL